MYRLLLVPGLALLLAGCRSPAPLAAPPPGVIASAPATTALPLPDGPLGFVELLALARAANPELAAADADAQAARGRAAQAARWANPELGLGVEELPARSNGWGEHTERVSLSQPLTAPGARLAAVRTAQAEHAQALARRQAAEREVAAELHLVLGELLYVRTARELYEDLLAVARSTLAAANVRLAAQAAPATEALKAELEVRELEVAARQLDGRLAPLAARLRAVLGGRDVPLTQVAPAWRAAAAPPAVDALDHHPALLAAARAATAAEWRWRQAAAERWPGVTVELGYERDVGADEHRVEAGISIPLPLFDRNDGAIAATRAEWQRAQAEAAALRQRLSAELAEELAAAATARADTTARQERLVPAATRVLAQTRIAYQAGDASLLDLLDAQRTLAEARLALLAARRDADLAAARLERLAGPLRPPPAEGASR